jgi:hypothetical protein
MIIIVLIIMFYIELIIIAVFIETTKFFLGTKFFN